MSCPGLQLETSVLHTPVDGLAYRLHRSEARRIVNETAGLLDAAGGAVRDVVPSGVGVLRGHGLAPFFPWQIGEIRLASEPPGQPLRIPAEGHRRGRDNVEALPRGGARMRRALRRRSTTPSGGGSLRFGLLFCHASHLLTSTTAGFALLLPSVCSWGFFTTAKMDSWTFRTAAKSSGRACVYMRFVLSFE